MAEPQRSRDDWTPRDVFVRVRLIHEIDEYDVTDFLFCEPEDSFIGIDAACSVGTIVPQGVVP